MIDIESFCEERLLTPAELADVVKCQREENGWTQETLAELSKLNTRTVQRVEKGEPSDLDTRRAIASALGWSDIDTFNKPWPIPDDEALKKEMRKLDEETSLLAVEKVSSGRHLRELVAAVSCLAFSQLTDLPEEIEQTFAELADYARDYGDVDDCYSAVEKLGVNKEFQEMIDTFEKAGYSLGAAIRKLVCPSNGERQKALALTSLHVVIGSTNGFPPNIRVPKQLKIGF